jgi:hypothetical protein
MSDQNLQNRLAIAVERLEEVNALLVDPNNALIGELIAIVEKHGGVEAINRKAEEARNLDTLKTRLKEMNSPYLDDLEWLAEMGGDGAFVDMEDYYERVLGEGKTGEGINQANAVTLEISALQYFPWLITQAKRSIENQDLMPGRFIRVRTMAEQTKDNGDTLAVAAAMQIVGASYVETLDTKGTDGSNIHLGGPATITGYFGGVGEPNHYPLKWVDEYLTYYTTYGIKQVLNINPGTIFAGYMLHKLGIDNEFKISVFMGNDNPFAILWTLMAAKLFARTSGSTPLIGFNFSNSVNADTIRQASYLREKLGLTDQVRFEHHITETYKSIVIQPYNRRDELLSVAKEVPNISAKHEGGEPEMEAELEHPSDILDYFRAKQEVESSGDMEKLENNYLEKHRSLNLTADALTRAGIGVVCARNLHK